MGSSFPSAKALVRTYIWLNLAPAASIASATTAQCEFQSTFDGTTNISELSPIPLVHSDSETRPLAEHAKRLSRR